ncbi:hypothetical protein B0H13DRAFT_678251 [Mycena leptocephala]|nr:hypothetical protein B0H13DRAFT_678251 [Mycena leptocephala]
MYLYPSSLSLLSASYTVIICRPAPLRLLPPAHSIPLRIRARFDCLVALTTLSRWPSPPRSWIYLAASRSRSVHRVMGAVQSRRLPLIYHQSYICARALLACGPTTPCLIPACGCADDTLLGMLCALAVGGAPHSFGPHGGRYLGFTPIFFAFTGCACCRTNASRPPFLCAGGSAVRSVHACEAATVTCASPACTPRISCAGRRGRMRMGMGTG